MGLLSIYLRRHYFPYIGEHWEKQPLLYNLVGDWRGVWTLLLKFRWRTNIKVQLKHTWCHGSHFRYLCNLMSYPFDMKRVQYLPQTQICASLYCNLHKIVKKEDFFSLCHPRLPMSVHKKYQPIRFSCLAGYRKKYIYECIIFFI